ncbi:hypothetical protein Gogos_018583 [Gossypium gossypioides]|uniref:DUF4283 domain-containing protein n=1 Tax=Gossypium gossypioides TaxID=34282 RepID=A0A7J9BEC0_GOSGO|nr:hypothetical protein [Gossypium gossypioides]
MLEDLDSPSKGSDSPAKVSWKQMFIGKGEQNQDENLKSLGKNCDGDLEFLEGDVKKSMVNGIPAIEFSERIQQILFKGMETTMVLKLLGRNIGYATLFNRISSLWRPTTPLPGLLGFMYKRRILEEVGGLVGKVVKFDLNTDSKTRGCFARMVVFVDLNKPLVSQVMVNREMKENLVLREDRILWGVAKETNNNEGIVARLLGKEKVGETILPVDYTKEGTVPFVNKNRAGGVSGLINGSVGHVLMEKSSNFNVSNTGHKDSLVDPKIQAKKLKTTRLNLKDCHDLGLRSVGQVAKELAFEQFKKGGLRKNSSNPLSIGSSSNKGHFNKCDEILLETCEQSTETNLNGTILGLNNRRDPS